MHLQDMNLEMDVQKKISRRPKKKFFGRRKEIGTMTCGNLRASVLSEIF